MSFLFKNMIQNEMVSATSVNLIKMVILGVGQDGVLRHFDYYFLLVFNGFVMFCSTPEGGFGTRQLYKFTLAWDHLTITIIGRMMMHCAIFLLASAIGMS